MASIHVPNVPAARRAGRSRLQPARLQRTALAAMLALGALPLMAQTGEPASSPSAASQTVTVSGRQAAVNSASVAGFGDLPLWRAPFSATVIRTDQLADAGIAGLGDLTRLDAGVTDDYNAPGYWSRMAVRGFTLDNRFNYRRDGLPINAESVIALGNKAGLELLKGTSGLQAGTSAPGGLVNLVVKRPQSGVRLASVGWQEDGTRSLAVDIGDRHGAAAQAGSWGWRINAGADQLNPTTEHSRGHRWLWSAAGDLRLGGGLLLEAELEWSRQSQPSTPGFSLLGNRLPDAASIDPRRNLNHQAWTLPVVMDGRTASLRLTQPLAEQVDLVVHAMRQRLDSDDRIAFPFGCSTADDYTRYCADGSFDLYDFRSENERRTSDALDASVRGQARWGGLQHRFNAGVLFTRYATDLGRQAYNWVGYGSVYQDVALPADATLSDDSTNRRERSTELHLQDAVELGPRHTLWLGMRHSRLQRDSRYTAPGDPRPTAYGQSLTTPWLALSMAIQPTLTGYASWGQGMESEVAPNRARYANSGQALPALKSEQLELGLKHRDAALDWRLAVFDIQRPVWSDIGVASGRPVASCSNAAPCLRRADGQARHRGLEAEAEWRAGAWALRGSALWLQARRRGSADAALNGREPTNVPARSLKAQAAYNVAALPGLALLAFASHESGRQVLPDNSIATPGWIRLDLGARYTQRLALGTVTWRAGIDNATDRRAWKEAPYQYSHAYLYPLAPRTIHASAQLAF